MKKFLAVSLLVLAVLLVGCSPPPYRAFADYYASTWVLGEHDLRYMERLQALEGSLSGGIFFTSGNLTTEQALTFAWEPKPGEVVITTLPLAQFYFIIDETRDAPTAEFSFGYGDSYNVLNGRGELANGIGEWGVLPERADVVSLNPNQFLEGRYFGGLDQVVVRISSATLESEIYLPH